MANYGRIGSGLDGFEGPCGSSCKTSPLNSLDHSSFLQVLLIVTVNICQNTYIFFVVSGVQTRTLHILYIAKIHMNNQ